MTYNPAVETPASYLISCIKTGIIADFGNSRAPVEAQLIRLIMLGLPLRDGSVLSVSTLPGIRIKGAKIEGPLDLNDCRFRPDGLAALVLENCDICDQINLHAARLARLSISQSRFSLVNLREAEIDGPFTFQNSRPHPDNEGVAWIDARGCVIKGEMQGREAQLHAPGPSHRHFGNVPDGGANYALGLQNADIRGNISIINLVADGGISIASANIRGAVYAKCTTLTGRVRDAFNAQNARIAGGLHLDSGCRSEGRVNLLGVHIGGALLFSDSQFSWMKPPGAGVPASNCSALVADNISIGTDLYIENVQVKGRASFEGCSIAGQVYAPAVGVEKPWITKEDRDWSALSFSGGRIGGDFNLKNSEILGRLEAIALYVGGTFHLNQTKIKASIANGHEIAFHGERLRSGGNVELKGDKEGTRGVFCCEGEINFCGAVIGRDLRVENAVVHNPGRSAIYAKDLQVGSDVRLLDVEVEGHINFERLEANGTLRWENLTFTRSGNPTATKFDLKKSRIGSTLEAYTLEANAPLGIDFGGAKASTISSDWTSGWGNDHTTINFDGFSYERLAFHDEAVGDKVLIKWLRRQRDPLASTESFRPQSYRQLTQVLRSQGHEQFARRVAIAERWAELSQDVRPVSRAYGFLFGFGYSRRRATITLLVYVLIGTCGVNAAFRSNMLVESSILTEPLFYSDEENHQMHVSASSSTLRSDAREVSCTKTAQNLLDQFVYSLDLVLPVIPLHQENKCEISASRDSLALYWRFSRAIYSIIGWIFSSLFLLTFSGILRSPEK